MKNTDKKEIRQAAIIWNLGYGKPEGNEVVYTALSEKDAARLMRKLEGIIPENEESTAHAHYDHEKQELRVQSNGIDATELISVLSLPSQAGSDDLKSRAFGALTAALRGNDARVALADAFTKAAGMTAEKAVDPAKRAAFNDAVGTIEKIVQHSTIDAFMEPAEIRSALQACARLADREARRLPNLGM